jgi:hypothetical protein
LTGSASLAEYHPLVPPRREVRSAVETNRGRVDDREEGFGDARIIEGALVFLKRIALDNVRSIEHLDLPATGSDGSVRKWTFVLGENGTGKSTLLRAIALVLAGREALPELPGNLETGSALGRR